MSKVSCWFCDRIRSLLLTICGPEQKPSPSKEIREGFIRTPEDVDRALERNIEEAGRFMHGIHEISEQGDPLRELIYRLRAGGAR